MDPDFENTYTMYCGGGGDSDSDSNGGSVTGGGDEDTYGGGYSEAEAQAAGVDTSQDTSFDDTSTTQNVEVGFQPVETPKLSIPENVSLTTPEMPTYTTPQTPSLTTPETPSLTEPTFTSPSYYSAEPPSESDSEDGITNYTETKSESLKAAVDTYKAEQAVGLRPSNLTTTAASLVTGLPIGTLSMSLGVMNAYNARRGNTTTSTTGSTASTGTTGLLDDTTSDGDSNEPIIYQTSTPLNNPADSAAIDFFANVKALDTRERYDLAKQKIAGITRPQAIDVQNSPYYNYLQKFNLNKGII